MADPARAGEMVNIPGEISYLKRQAENRFLNEKRLQYQDKGMSWQNALVNAEEDLKKMKDRGEFDSDRMYDILREQLETQNKALKVAEDNKKLADEASQKQKDIESKVKMADLPRIGAGVGAGMPGTIGFGANANSWNLFAGMNLMNWLGGGAGGFGGTPAATRSRG
jgi:hypothetical protein